MVLNSHARNLKIHSDPHCHLLQCHRITHAGATLGHRDMQPFISALFSEKNKILMHSENLIFPFSQKWASLVAQLVKNPPAMQETLVRSLGWEDPLEKGKAIHSSTLDWRIPWTVQSYGFTKSLTQLSDFHSTYLDDLDCQAN